MLPRSATKTVTFTTDDGQTLITTEAAITFDTLIGPDLNVPPCCVNKEYVLTIPVISPVTLLNVLQCFALALFKADGDPGQSGPITVQFDLGPSPAPMTFSVSEATGLCWINGDIGTCPITANVLTIWVTNPNTANMVLQIRAGVNSTVYQ